MASSCLLFYESFILDQNFLNLLFLFVYDFKILFDFVADQFCLLELEQGKLIRIFFC